MQRHTEEIDGIDVFTYDVDLFAEAMKMTRPELYELAKARKYRGISGLRKYDLAVIAADGMTYKRDEQRKLVNQAQRVDELIEQLDGNPAEPRRDRALTRDDMCLGDFGAYGNCVLQRGHDGRMCEDTFGRGFVAREGTRRPADHNAPRCTRKAVAHNGTETKYACGLYLDSDGVCPNWRHRVAWRPTVLINLKNHQRYVVLGTDDTGALIIRHACGTACSETSRRVPQETLAANYRAVCWHNNGPQELCESCGEIDENGDQTELCEHHKNPADCWLCPVPETPDAPQADPRPFDVDWPRVAQDMMLKLGRERQRTDALVHEKAEVLQTVGQLATYWELQATRQGLLPRAPWVALRAIVKEHEK